MLGAGYPLAQAAAVPEHGALTVFFLVTLALYAASLATIYFVFTRAVRGRFVDALLASLALLLATLLAWVFFPVLPAGTVEVLTEEGRRVTPIYAPNPYRDLLLLPLAASLSCLALSAIAIVVYSVRIGGRIARARILVE